MCVLDYYPASDKEEKRKAEANKDIQRIEETLTDNKNAVDLHRELDGKYQACIKDWGKSMYKYSESAGFRYSSLTPEYIQHNLKLMRAKIEAYADGKNIAENSMNEKQDVTVNVNNSNSNIVNISITFDDVRKSIEEMGALTESETEEIKTKIDELERIANEKSSKKNKWEKIKPIIAFALEKGVDIATQILMLVVQMKLGK